MTSVRNQRRSWIARCCGIVAAAVLLAGCITSQRPMFPTATAAHPIETGRYRLFERDGSDFKPSDLVVVRDGAAGGYDFVDDQGKATAVSFHPIGARFVGQAREKEGFIYAVFEITPRTVLVYAIECDKQDKGRMTALAVEVNEHECKIDRVGDAAAFFSAIDIGQPTSKMERE